MKKAKTSCLVAASLALIFAAQGCYGSFRVTQQLHTWNREIENRWLGAGVFAVFRVFYVYSAAFVSDALIFNSWEFWSDENPINGVSAERLKAIRDADDARAAEADKK